MRAIFLTTLLTTFSPYMAYANERCGVTYFSITEINSLLSRLSAIAKVMNRYTSVDLFYAYDSELICNANQSLPDSTGMTALIFSHSSSGNYRARYFHSMSSAAQYAQECGLCVDGGTGSQEGLDTLKYVAAKNQLSLEFTTFFVSSYSSKLPYEPYVDMDNRAYSTEGLESVADCTCYETDFLYSDYLGRAQGRGENRREAELDALRNCPASGSWQDVFTDADEVGLGSCAHTYEPSALSSNAKTQ